MMIQFSTLFFYMFSACIVTSSLLVISLRNPVHAVLALITTFLSASGLLIMIGADFIAMSLIIVYVGAVAVLFLFIVMMLNTKNTKKSKISIYYIVFAFLIASMLMANLYIVIAKSSNPQDIVPQYAINQDITNTVSIGNILYTQFFYPFQLAGILLLLAMVAAIVLTNHEKKPIKRQDMVKQFNRKRIDSVKLVDVKFNQGVKNEY